MQLCFDFVILVMLDSCFIKLKQPLLFLQITAVGIYLISSGKTTVKSILKSVGA